MNLLEYDDKSRVIRWSLQGDVTAEGLDEGLKLVARAVPGLLAKGGIVNLSGVTSFDVATKDLQRLSTTDPILPGHILRVIVAHSDFTYGLSRMFVSLSEHKRPNSQVVRTMDEAFRLLGIDTPDFRVVEL